MPPGWLASSARSSPRERTAARKLAAEYFQRFPIKQCPSKINCWIGVGGRRNWPLNAGLRVRIAAEYFQRFPKDHYQTEVENWRELQSQNIEFTMKRLREPIEKATEIAK